MTFIDRAVGVGDHKFDACIIEEVIKINFKCESLMCKIDAIAYNHCYNQE